ncbi:putative helicase [Enhygromyxa salina]|uniref:Putative helicase n=1 Tax=Enhygromyxa salina TaxID=215803 RepID=A0A0C2A2Y9_9BACT|nr:AAA domain-containing protein [Enhygromyxa salina]KIG17728.1 putative helicase [Enhygromyxa salina]
MSTLYYMALAEGGRWDATLKQVGAQLRPYDQFLRTALEAAERHRPVLAWRDPTRDEAATFNARMRARIERSNEGARAAERRRDRREKDIPRGTWIILEPPPWRAEEPESTFEEFLRSEEFNDQPDGRSTGKITRMAWDNEGCALLVDHPPIAVAPQTGREQLRSTEAHPHGRLLWIRPNTHNLRCQKYALHSLDNFPVPSLQPLINLLRTHPSWPRFEQVTLDETAWTFLKEESPGAPLRDGTTEQRRFVEVALASPDFALLEGPPGSGKTTAICELIVQLARRGLRTLLVASTNVAVDNVLERLISWQERLPPDEQVVLPVRIGTSERVSSTEIEPFLYDRLQRTVCDNIVDFTESKGGTELGSQARAMLRQTLLQEEASHDRSRAASPIRQLVGESVNLVCGTPIGVLKHPEIRERREPGPRVLFDVLIVDEASKTTLTEFMVPAIYAAKWIVVGDIKQLSPYVEGEDIGRNLRHWVLDLGAEAAAYAAVRAFQATPGSGGKMVRSLIACDSDDAEALRIEANARATPCADLDNCEVQSVAGVPGVIPELIAPNLVFGRPDTLAAFEHRLPENMDLLEGALPPLSDYRAVRAHFKEEEPESAKDWSTEYGWRLVRSFELRHNEVERATLQAQLDELLPKSLNSGITKKLRERSDQIRRVALPSILELLQTGFERLPGWKQGAVINDGLPPAALAQRMVSLSYQHRMHPDISAFSREQFYTGSDDRPALLRDARSIERAWGYRRHARRALWVDVQRPRNERASENSAEAKIVMRELQHFVKWAQHDGRRDKPWSVAILTFYRGQEALLRKRLLKLTKQHGNTRNFAIPSTHPAVNVTLCTVDRFQGHEADLVLLSFVRGGTRKRGSVGFLNSPNRLNVALTRARYQILLIGDRSYFAACRSELLQTLAGSPHYMGDIAWGEDQ